jgi:prenyltransferase beta subunit
MLGEAAPLVQNYLISHQAAGGGFFDREERPDLYYTVFGLDALAALGADKSALTADHGGFLHRAQLWDLDFVHRCCLLRSLSALGLVSEASSLVEPLEQWRTSDGGYSQKRGAARCTAYGNLLAYSAYADCGLTCPEPHRLLESVLDLGAGDDGFANEPGLAHGTTTATAAAIALLGQLTPEFSTNTEVRQSFAAWFRRQWHPQGGFLAFAHAPMPDLLSTATALHALTVLESPLQGEMRETCLDFVDSLWSASGGFHGHWADDFLDVEYTYYGLLALGHLSLGA